MIGPYRFGLVNKSDPLDLDLAARRERVRGWRRFSPERDDAAALASVVDDDGGPVVLLAPGGDDGAQEGSAKSMEVTVVTRAS